jgi:hypothetical protein
MRHHLVFGATAAALLAGCAHSIRLKTVDATTHEPVEGVSVQWVQFKHEMLWRSKQEGPTNLPPSGAGGIVKVKGLHRWWSSDFTFSCVGYSNLYGIYGSGNLSVSAKARHFSHGPFQDQFWLENPLKAAAKSNDCFLVEMRK